MAQLGLAPATLAAATGIPLGTVMRLVASERPVTASVALRLAKYLGTSPDFWMQAQAHHDMYHALVREGEAITAIRSFAAS